MKRLTMVCGIWQVLNTCVLVLLLLLRKGQVLSAPTPSLLVTQ